MKTKLIELATSKPIGFKSQMFTDSDWKHSIKEDLRYYLWMCELKKWIISHHGVQVVIINNYHSPIGQWWFQSDLFTCAKVLVESKDTENHDTYEQALEEGLYQTLLLIQKENGKDN